jgi:hypothetical protein
VEEDGVDNGGGVEDNMDEEIALGGIQDILNERDEEEEDASVGGEEEMQNEEIGGNEEPDFEDEGVTMAQVRNEIVSESTHHCYVHETYTFLSWVMQHRRHSITEFGIELFDYGMAMEVGEGVRAHRRRVKMMMDDALRNARELGIMQLDLIDPEGFMEYILSVCHRNTQQYLSKKSFENKCASLFHLYRCHNMSGFPEGFCLQLTNLFKGFYRNIARQGASIAVVRDHWVCQGQDPALHLHQRTVKEGKELMSMELYRSLYQWFLEWGTLDGIFAYTFLIITWNLACRA